MQFSIVLIPRCETATHARKCRPFASGRRQPRVTISVFYKWENRYPERRRPGSAGSSRSKNLHYWHSITRILPLVALFRSHQFRTLHCLDALFPPTHLPMKNNASGTYDAANLPQMTSTRVGRSNTISACILALAAMLPSSTFAQLAPETARAIDGIVVRIDCHRQRRHAGLFAGVWDCTH